MRRPTLTVPARGAPLNPQVGTKERPPGTNKGTAQTREAIDDVITNLTRRVLREDETTMEDGSSRRVRTLVTQMARRDLSGNKIACALISMMARSTCSNPKPNTLTQDRISQRRQKASCTARPDHTLGSLTSFLNRSPDVCLSPHSSGKAILAGHSVTAKRQKGDGRGRAGNQ